MNPEPRIELQIQGMDCASCAAGIERNLKRLGLADASVNFATSSAYFTPSHDLPVDRVVQEIGKLGFSAYPSDAAHNHGAADSHLPLKVRAAVAAILTVPLALHMVLPWHPLHSPAVQWALATPVYLIGLFQFGRSALGSIRARMPNMDVLIVIGISAAYFYSLAGYLLGLGPDYLFFETSAAIVTLVLIGNLLERYSVSKTSRAIEELSRAQPSRAKLVTTSASGEMVTEIETSQIKPGDLLRINTGDRIPTDGVIETGSVYADESILTGESEPLERGPGGTVIGGAAVHSGTAEMRASQVGDHTVLAEILRLVRDAQGNKPQIQRLGDLVSAYFTPIVLAIAAVTFLGWYAFAGASFGASLLCAVAVLVIACPCAMGLATPTAVMVGIGRAARHGILVRGGDSLERLAGVKTIIFDKTGTLTTGKFELRELECSGEDQERVKSLIHGLELHSSHPIAQSLVRAFGASAPARFEQIDERKGFGMWARDAAGDEYMLGSPRMGAVETGQDAAIHLFKNGAVIARIKLEDELKTGAEAAVSALKRLGIEPVILSGDSAERCDAIARRLQITRVYSRRTPAEKLAIVEELERKGSTAFVGDGVNDAPALAKSKVGIAMSDGTHLAIQSSDIVLLHGSLDRLSECVALARATLLTIKQNLFWAFFYNVLAIPIAALGFLNPAVAAFAMALSDVMTIGNSLRLRKKALAGITDAAIH